MDTQFWRTNIVYLKSVGPKRAAALWDELGIATYEDLLNYYPYRYVDRRSVSKISKLSTEGEYVTLIGKLGAFNLIEGKRPRLACTLSDGSGKLLELSWFQGINWVTQKFRENDEVVLFGRVTFFRDQPQIPHPEMETLNDDDSLSTNLQILPFYNSTEKLKRQQLDARGVRKLIRGLLEQGAERIYETLPPAMLKEQNLISRKAALVNIHSPENFEMLEKAKKRLKYDELFFFQLMLARRRKTTIATRTCHPFTKIGDYFNVFYGKYLPFQLTNAQKRVIKEIRHDVGRPFQMNRLVQGDVGSGKTMVAIMAMLMALDNGFQSALMAPTEILAEQHYLGISKLLAPMGVGVELLTGSVKAKERRRILENLSSGGCKILIGTHALIEDWVQFNNLGLTIIDEQHKFGVMQRARLWNKSTTFPHNLAMSATPIPRTLAMSLYGDIDVSVIDELPPGRKPVVTRMMTEANRLEVFGFVKKELKKGRQAYFVYPLVEESAKLDLLACQAGYESICRAFPDYQVGIVNGKMKSDDKELEMRRFKNNETQILVATTVIEVGVDVPNATIMVIENAERYGLSQLHQLRGRVGRGGNQSVNILLTPYRPKGDALKRLQAMCETNDGFKIAEIDLELRGPGDFLGTKQSGLPDFKLANLATDGAILQAAREAAFKIAAEDFNLEAPELAATRVYYAIYIDKYKLEELTA